ncbi:hypothetical protein HYX02_03275 [Candidatus Woesearchaeota archaeon]|nr:hypothetical protein [Candidatus Woesearchaeota archaeon]
MKKAFACLALLTIFLIACAPQQKEAPPTISKTEIKTESQEPQTTTQQKQEIAQEVKDLLEKHKTRVQSISYKYRGPETGNNFYVFYVKGSKIRYNPYLEIKTLDSPDSYDAIFIDKTAKTAASYCIAAHCLYKGKKQDLIYDDAYIATITDLVSGLAQANKVGEEVIDDRNTWKIETNKGTLWVDTFYGVPLKVESGGKTYKFEQVSVNSVQDSDVVAS